MHWTKQTHISVFTEQPCTEKDTHKASLPAVLEASMNSVHFEGEVGSFCFSLLVLWWAREEGRATATISANCCLCSPSARWCLTCQNFKTSKTNANYLGIPGKVRALDVWINFPSPRGIWQLGFFICFWYVEQGGGSVVSISLRCHLHSPPSY